MPARIDSPDWQYSLNAEGPIVVRCAYSLPPGEDYVAKISYVGDRGLIGEVSAASRALALAAAMELLDEKELLGKLPVSFVNDLSDYRTV